VAALLPALLFPATLLFMPTVVCKPDSTRTFTRPGRGMANPFYSRGTGDARGASTQIVYSQRSPHANWQDAKFGGSLRLVAPQWDRFAWGTGVVPSLATYGCEDCSPRPRDPCRPSQRLRVEPRSGGAGSAQPQPSGSGSACIIAAFFMHALFESGLVRMVMAAGLVWILIFLSLICEPGLALRSGALQAVNLSGREFETSIRLPKRMSKTDPLFDSPAFDSPVTSATRRASETASVTSVLTH